MFMTYPIKLVSIDVDFTPVTYDAHPSDSKAIAKHVTKADNNGCGVAEAIHTLIPECISIRIPVEFIPSSEYPI